MLRMNPACEPVEDRHGAMVASLPALRAFARALTGARDSADDLVRSAITRGLAPDRNAPPAVNGTVWLLSILHDLHQDIDTPAKPPRAAADDDAFGDAFWRLQDNERQALVLTVAAGLSSAEAAFVCGCSVTTIGMRAIQGRHALLRARATDGARVS
jgi:RNA polymerase sigma-70 factor (ECF subfamily)